MTDFSDTTVMETDGPVDAERLVPVHLASARVATERPGAERYFWWWLALIAGAGLFLRAFVVLHSQMYWVGGDGFSYSVAANLFAQGRHPGVPGVVATQTAQPLRHQ